LPVISAHKLLEVAKEEKTVAKSANPPMLKAQRRHVVIAGADLGGLSLAEPGASPPLMRSAG
jgi:hypothetical protein